MSRVLLTVLGTNNYMPCCYQLGDDIDRRPVRFVQEAVVRHYCRGWQQPDKIIVFLTNKDGGSGEDGSLEKNWRDNGHGDGQEGLDGVLKKLSCKQPYRGIADIIRPVIIPWGKDKKELWNIFRQVAEGIQENDKVVFDVTHSFRSLPLLVFAALLFASRIKNAEVTAVTYGAFEVLGPVGKIKEKYPDPIDRKAPVFDLSELLLIADWTEAAMLFKDYGEADPLLNMLGYEIKPLLKETQGRDAVANAARNLSKQINDFVSAIKTVRGKEIVKCDNFDSAVSAVKSAGVQGGPMWAFEQLLDIIRQKAAEFEPGNLMNGLNAAAYCVEHGLVQQAFTLLDETLVSMQCSILDLDWKNQTHREIVSSAPSIKEKPEEEWFGSSGNNRELTRRVINAISKDSEYLKLVSSLNLRDDINHAGMSTNAAHPKTLSDKAWDIYESAVRWAKSQHHILSVQTDTTE